MPTLVAPPLAGELSAEEKLVLDHAVARFAGRPGALLGILEAVQAASRHKYLSLEALQYLSAQTGIPPSTIYSVATFYALFNLDPQGDNVVCVCRGTACHTRGSRGLLDKLCLDLGLGGRPQEGDGDSGALALTTADRRFTVRTVACFGQCALAPVVEVNHRILSHVNERSLEREVHALEEGRKA